MKDKHNIAMTKVVMINRGYCIIIKERNIFHKIILENLVLTKQEHCNSIIKINLIFTQIHLQMI